jgi:hypothetical protein
MTNFEMASLVIAGAMMISVTGFFNESHAQELTSEQKAKLCSPDNPALKFVNSTESKICGIPPSPPSSSNQTNSSISIRPTAPTPTSP